MIYGVISALITSGSLGTLKCSKNFLSSAFLLKDKNNFEGFT